MPGPTATTRALIESVPEDVWEYLRQLHSQVTKTRGWTSLDSDSRIAGDEFYEVVKHVHENYGISLWSMALHLGLNGRTIKHWMFSHGYIYNGSSKPPSLKAYQGKVSHGHGAPPYQIGGKCRRGHDLTEATLGVTPKQNYCKVCQHAAFERRSS